MVTEDGVEGVAAPKGPGLIKAWFVDFVSMEQTPENSSAPTMKRMTG
jgi:hypothetical protein